MVNWLLSSKRVLRNVPERGVIVAGEGTITSHHLPMDFGLLGGIRSKQPPIVEPDAVRLPVGTTFAQAERALILITLQAHREQQDSCCRNPWHKPQDSVHQVEAVRHDRTRSFRADINGRRLSSATARKFHRTPLDQVRPQSLLGDNCDAIRRGRVSMGPDHECQPGSQRSTVIGERRTIVPTAIEF